MSTKDIEITVEGPQAEKVAGELAKLIKDTLGHEVSPVPAKKGTARPGDKAMDLVALGLTSLGLVIAFPPSLLALIEVTDRLKKKPKADELAEALKAICERNPDTVIRIGDGSGVAENVKGINGGENLIELCSRADK